MHCTQVYMHRIDAAHGFMMPCIINSLWPSDTLWCHKCESSLALPLVWRSAIILTNAVSWTPPSWKKPTKKQWKLHHYADNISPKNYVKMSSAKCYLEWQLNECGLNNFTQAILLNTCTAMALQTTPWHFLMEPLNFQKISIRFHTIPWGFMPDELPLFIARLPWSSLMHVHVQHASLGASLGQQDVIVCLLFVYIH